MSASRTLHPNLPVVAIVIAGVVLLGLDRFTEIAPVRAAATMLYQWGYILAAFALVLGVANVTWVHLRQIVVGSGGWPQSLALVAALLLTLLLGLTGSDGVRSPLVAWVFDNVITPGQATLFALPVFFMLVAAYRYLRVGRTGGVWMLTGLLLVVVGQMPAAQSLLPGALPGLTAWLLDVPGMAALRGALLGSAFALILVAVRALFTLR
jgi:hypothetical protein